MEQDHQQEAEISQGQCRPKVPNGGWDDRAVARVGEAVRDSHQQCGTSWPVENAVNPRRGDGNRSRIMPRMSWRDCRNVSMARHVVCRGTIANSGSPHSGQHSSFMAPNLRVLGQFGLGMPKSPQYGFWVVCRWLASSTGRPYLCEVYLDVTNRPLVASDS